MTINITNPEVDRLARQFAKMEGVSLTEAVAIAMREAVERRRASETAQQTAARLRAELGIALTPEARKPLPRSFYDEISGES
ncbi:MAG: type II toxin-antitoxin system VapB family antitoxin [Salaquimonas sp.]|jgi:antitoxin VapB|nr:type II toxin-antitoxin system VapB family antitoxin [Salaquimonas sp.]